MLGLVRACATVLALSTTSAAQTSNAPPAATLPVPQCSVGSRPATEATWWTVQCTSSGDEQPLVAIVDAAEVREHGTGHVEALIPRSAAHPVLVMTLPGRWLRTVSLQPASSGATSVEAGYPVDASTTRFATITTLGSDKVPLEDAQVQVNLPQSEVDISPLVCRPILRADGTRTGAVACPWRADLAVRTVGAFSSRALSWDKPPAKSDAVSVSLPERRASVQVRSSAGPLPAVLAWRVAAGPADHETIATGTSDRSRLLLPLSDGAPHRIRVRAEHHQDFSLDLPAGKQLPETVVLHALARLTGEVPADVRDARDSLGIEIKWEGTENQSEQMVRLAKDGSFELPKLEPGKVMLTARLPGYDPLVHEHLELLPGTDTPLGSLAFSGGLQLVGEVMDEQEQPLEGVSVVAYSEDHGLRYSSKAATTDATGAFVLHGVPDVPLRLIARNPSFRTAVVKHPSPAESGSVSITMKRGARLVGTVRDADGNLLAGEQVTVEGDDGDAPVATLFNRKVATTDADGRYEISGLPSGPVAVMWRALAWEDVKVEAGKDTELDLAIPDGSVEVRVHAKADCQGTARLGPSPCSGAHQATLERTSQQDLHVRFDGLRGCDYPLMISLDCTCAEGALPTIREMHPITLPNGAHQVVEVQVDPVRVDLLGSSGGAGDSLRATFSAGGAAYTLGEGTTIAALTVPPHTTRSIILPQRGDYHLRLDRLSEQRDSTVQVAGPMTLSLSDLWDAAAPPTR